MNTKIINLDSCYSQYIYDSNNTANTYLSPYNSQYTFSNPLRNIKRIALMSIEMPLLFNNIRGSTNNISSLNYLSFTYAYLSVNYTFSVNITENFYNTINSLLTVINSLISSDSTLTSRGIQVVFSVNSFNKVVVTTNSSYIAINNTLNNNRNRYPFMTQILGFGELQSTNSGSLTATNRFNLNVDNYVNLQLVNLGNNQNINNIGCSFKIPLNAVNGTIYYNFHNATYDQFIDNTDTNFILDKLTIKIVDRFNNNINPNGGDYSLSLLVWYQT